MQSTFTRWRSKYILKAISTIICTALVIVGAVLPTSTATATTVLDPIIVFEGRTRQVAVRLVNAHSHVMTYRISIVNLRKQPDGSYIEVEAPDPADRFARDLLEFSPRQTTVAPNQTQTIRLILRKPADLPPGNYRSFLRITELPPANNPAPGMGVVVMLTHQFPITVKN